MGGSYHHASRPCQHHLAFGYRAKLEGVCGLGRVSHSRGSVRSYVDEIKRAGARRRRTSTSSRHPSGLSRSSTTCMPVGICSNSLMPADSGYSKGEGLSGLQLVMQSEWSGVQVQRRRRGLEEEARQGTRGSWPVSARSRWFQRTRKRCHWRAWVHCTPASCGARDRRLHTRKRWYAKCRPTRSQPVDPPSRPLAKERTSACRRVHLL